jgi:hypothetical protein
MNNKEKTLCDWDKKEIDKRFDQLAKIVQVPKYICRKCARVAQKKDYLCKPQIINNIKT